MLAPDGRFLLAPDLGADRVRVLRVDGETGQLASGCADIPFERGSGPRHAVFYTGLGHGRTMLYTVSELGGNLTVFEQQQQQPPDSDGCPRFRQVQTLVPYANGSLPAGATPAAIQLVDHYLYVSVRNDRGFAGSDSVVALEIELEHGTVALRATTPSHGLVPRTLALNRAGDLLAIGNQASASVAVVRRDVGSGQLGEVLGIVRAGERGRPGEAEGLSSVVFG